MNAKKFLSIVLICLLALPMVFTGCKKGDEDPFLTFRSRKARVEGTWTVTKRTSEVIRKENNVNTKTETTVDGDSWKQVITIDGTDSVRTLNGKITKEPNQQEGTYYFKFYKDGRAEMKYKYEYSEDLSGEDDDVATVITTKVTEEMTGTWNFLAGIDDYKNKERLAFVIEDKKTTTYTYKSITSDDDEGGVTVPQLLSKDVVNDKYANGVVSTIYAIKELKNKEMKLYQKIDSFFLQEQLQGSSNSGASYQDNGFEELVLTPRK